MNQLSPQEQINRMLTGYWITQALYVAAKLGLADLLKNGPKSSDDWLQPQRPTQDRFTACSMH